MSVLLFEHEDGRYAVNPDTTGDPKWHRLGPVELPGATQAAVLTELDPKEFAELLTRSDLLDMHIHSGWYSAPRRAFDVNSAKLAHEITLALARKNGLTVAGRSI